MNMLGPVLIISVASCLPLHIICGSVDIDANEDSNLPFVLDELKLENSQRIGRGLMSFRPRIVSINSLFNIVTFPKGQCNSTDTGLSGTCYNYNECKKLGGTASGTCANGFGVCCVFQKSCRNITSEAISYFINPSYPASDQTVQVCDYRIDIPSTRQGKSLDGETTTSRICQVRLDFEEFTLPEPETVAPNIGQCLRSKMMLTGSAGVTYRVAQFCGVLTGQHMYLEINPDLEDSTYFSLMAIIGVENPSDPVPQYSWKIKITQINCATENYLRAPAGCLQYFYGQRGNVESLNSRGTGGYFRSLDYDICLRTELNACAVEWKADAFDIVGSQTPGANGDAVCQQDYLIIPQVILDTGENKDRFCSSVLSNVTGTTPTETAVYMPINGPIAIRFRSNADNLNGQGFRLTFRQLVPSETDLC